MHSGGVSQLQSFQGTFDKGRRQMNKKISPPEWRRKGYMEQALYDQVDKYAVAEDLKYDELIEIKMLSSYRNVDTLQHPLDIVYERQFGQKRRGARNVVAIMNENGVKYALIYHPKGLRECQHLVVNAADSLTQNGTWNIGGNVVNLRLDELNYITGHGSLNFDINGSSTTGFIENFTMKAVDILDYFGKGACFTWMNIPIPQELVSVKLTLGSNTANLATDLYYGTVNQPHDNNEFTTMWNLLKYMLKDMTMVGNPDPKSIAYFRLDFTTTGQPIPGCNIDNVVVRKGVVYEYKYNTPWCLIDAQTKAWKMFTTADSDIIVAEEDTYQILMLEVTLAAMREAYGNNFSASTDVGDTKMDLAEAYTDYALNHTDEQIEPSEETYVLGDFMNGYTADSVVDDWGDDSGSRGQVDSAQAQQY